MSAYIAFGVFAAYLASALDYDLTDQKRSDCSGEQWTLDAKFVHLHYDYDYAFLAAVPSIVLEELDSALEVSLRTFYQSPFADTILSQQSFKVNILRCLILPIAYGIYLSISQRLLSVLNNVSSLFPLCVTADETPPPRTHTERHRQSRPNREPK